MRNWQSCPRAVKILDAGCGYQPFRKVCSHLKYFAQDFAGYDGKNDGKGLHNEGWHYGKLDYTGDIWDIKAKSGSFDAILCTEVLEHVPYPIESIREFGRLLKKGGTLILTVPINCIPHQTPYFFYHGISRQLYEKIGSEAGLKLVSFHTYPSVSQFLFLESLRHALTRPLPFKLIGLAYLLPWGLWAKLTEPRHYGETYPAAGSLMILKKR